MIIISKNSSKSRASEVITLRPLDPRFSRKSSRSEHVEKKKEEKKKNVSFAK